MNERCGHARGPTWQAGTVYAGEQVFACTILDVSATGACILVTPKTGVPETFRLTIDGREDNFQCEVRWRRRSRVGVQFSNVI
jgi:PilZ domain